VTIALTARGPLEGTSAEHYLLGSFNDLAGFQTTSACLNALNAATDQGPDPLQIRFEPAASSVICVTDLITELRTLAADIATFGHNVKPPGWKSPYESKQSFYHIRPDPRQTATRASAISS
jgi:hypothetical protein